ALHGTPADCVLIGAFYVCNEMPDLVISGINFGANIGNSFILSSATVGAAMEASFLGIKSMAVSLLLNPLKADMNAMKDSKANLHIRKDLKKEDFLVSAKITRKIADHVLKHPNLPPNTDLININVPKEATLNSEIHFTRVSQVHYGNVFKKLEDEPESCYVFNKFARDGQYQFIEGTDIYSTFIKNSISITPISLDLSGDVEKLKKYFNNVF
ncbi:MAG: 5'/3'-nucleotidase SurE, partial [Candidatus Helarchaeota archaeon]